jgi:methylenetetrahydrofolate reductase (NADPH)
MQDHIARKMYHIEVLTPKQNSEKLEEDIQNFEVKYRRVLDEGYTVCITDNPMGLLSFQGTEMIAELGLPVKTEQVMLHLNTFHTKPDLDNILNTCCEKGIRNLLVISGDGNERLPRLKGSDVGFAVESVTSVELLRYIERAYPGQFHMGVAFNPYEPQDHEVEKMKRKVDAGARFVITQPIIEQHEALANLAPFGLPVVVECWMSKKLSLLSQCVGYEIPEGTPYDPLGNLKTLITRYPTFGFYLAILGFKTQLPLIREVWQ